MLRKNSFQEEKAATGPFLLGLGLAVSLFFGGAIRTFLGPAQVRQFIEAELSSRRTKFELNFSGAELSLSRGWLPRLGLELRGVSIQAKSVCDTPLRLEIESVYIPIYLWKAFNQELKFKTIQFSQVDLSLRSDSELSGCRSSRNDEKLVVGTELSEKSVAKPETKKPEDPKNSFDVFMEQFNRFIVTRWAKELKSTSRWLDGVEVEKFLVKGVLPRDIDVYFQDIELSVEPGGESASLQLKAKPTSESVYFLPLETFHLQMNVTPKTLSADVSTGFKEGEWELDARLSLDSMQLNAESTLKTFPLSEILAGLSKSGLIKEVGDYPRSVWMSCHQGMSGSLIKWKDLFLSTSGCAVSGDLGVMTLKDHELQPFSNQQPAQDFLLDINRFSLRNFLQGLGVSGAKGVLHRYGFLTGNLRFRTLNEVLFDGFIEEFAIIFSRKGRRQIQEVDRAFGEILFRDSRVSAKLTQASVQGGGFKGQVSVNVDPSFSEGVFQASVSNLELDSSIEKLLLDGGQIGGLELYGKGSFQNGKLSSWTGNLGISDLSAREIQLAEIKTSSEWSGDSMIGELSIGSISFGASQPLYELFFPLYLNELERGDEVKWTNVKTSYLIDSEKVKWTNSTSTDSKRSARFTSAGSWTENGELSGSINVSFPKMNLLTWSLTGTRLEPLLVPADNVLRELVPQMPSYKESIKVELENTSDLFGKLVELRKSLNFSTLKEKVVDSAKRLIPSGDELVGDRPEPESSKTE